VTIKFLAPHNPSVIYLCARPLSIPSAEALISEIKASSPDVNIRILPLDLSSLASVRNFADDFLKEADRLDLLFLNAGISTTAPALTQDGYESQFGINYVGHALLTQLLMPKLLETAAKRDRNNRVRIMVTSSMAAHINPPPTGLVLNEMKNNDDPLDSAYQRYAHSKLAAILFARKLAQLYPSIQTVAFNPGQVKTDLFRKANGLSWWVNTFLAIPLMHLTGVSPEKGAENGLWVALSDDVKNGAYYEPVGVLTEGKKFFSDQKLTEELWRWTNDELAAHGGPGWPEAS
jgi:NAD(P)-dependent dehydrogenase (short-subunit alcohol dehydrogenase family)